MDSEFYCCYVDGKGSAVVRHETLSGARQEAERLARMENKKVFILRAIECCSTVVFHKLGSEIVWNEEVFAW